MIQVARFDRILSAITEFVAWGNYPQSHLVVQFYSLPYGYEHLEKASVYIYEYMYQYVFCRKSVLG